MTINIPFASCSRKRDNGRKEILRVRRKVRMDSEINCKLFRQRKTICGH